MGTNEGTSRAGARTSEPTAEKLVAMAARCRKVSERRQGTPILDDAAEMLDEASFIARENERLRSVLADVLEKLELLRATLQGNTR
jgi:hypothetical protein